VASRDSFKTTPLLLFPFLGAFHSVCCLLVPTFPAYKGHLVFPYSFLLDLPSRPPPFWSHNLFVLFFSSFFLSLSLKPIAQCNPLCHTLRHWYFASLEMDVLFSLPFLCVVTMNAFPGTSFLLVTRYMDPHAYLLRFPSTPKYQVLRLSSSPILVLGVFAVLALTSYSSRVFSLLFFLPPFLICY